MSELLSCPFCGGKADVMLTQGRYGQSYNIHHESIEKCPAAYVGMMNFASEAEAIEAWNTRHKSVFVTGTTVATDGEPVTYAPTRTCEFNIKDNMNETEGMGDVWIECSACHCVFDFYADEWLMKMSYCPNCGSKVIA